MPKTKISEFDSTPANNTDIDSINIAEGCAPSGINNAIRELMSQLKDQQTGASGDNFTVGGNLAVTGTSTFTGIPSGPTASAGTNTTQLATTAFVFAERSNTSTLTNKTLTSPTISGGSISGITDLAVADGGTGQSSFTDGQLLIGNSTGNTLTKATLTAGTNITITNGNGSITIAASSGEGGGGVTSVATGNGLSGGTITSTGTLVIAAPSAGSIGSYASVTGQGVGSGTFVFGSNYSAGAFSSQLQTYCESVDISNGRVSFTRGGNSSLSGTWKWLSADSPSLGSNEYAIGIAVRVA
jgi:hypothetical protein